MQTLQMAILKYLLKLNILVARMVNNPLQMQETRVLSLGWGDSLEEEMATDSSILAGKSHG